MVQTPAYERGAAHRAAARWSHEPLIWYIRGWMENPSRIFKKWTETSAIPFLLSGGSESRAVL
jgi:hypothetical protein